MEILSFIFKFSLIRSYSIEMNERILSCIAAARIIPEHRGKIGAGFMIETYFFDNFFDSEGKVDIHYNFKMINVFNLEKN